MPQTKLPTLCSVVALAVCRDDGVRGWAKAHRAVPTAFRTVGTRSLSSGADLRDPLALPTLALGAPLEAGHDSGGDE